MTPRVAIAALRALAYADGRALLNEMRSILRSPGRLIGWVMYALVIAFFAWSRTGRSPSAGGDAAGTFGTDYAVYALLGTLAIGLGAGRRAVLFRFPAEAQFIIGAPIPPALAVAYLQARASMGDGWRALSSLFYLLVLFAPKRLGLAALLADFVTFVAIFAAGTAIGVPRKLLRPPTSSLCAFAGVALGLGLASLAARDVVLQLRLTGSVAAFVLATVPAWHPGRALIDPQPAWIGAAVGLAAAGMGWLALRGDSYPELYALSQRRFAGATLMAERLERRHAKNAPASTAQPAPAFAGAVAVLTGPAAFVWKSVMEGRWLWNGRAVALFVAFWLLVGFIATRVTSALGGAAFGFAAALVAAVLMLSAPMLASGLAAELHRPLFRLAPVAFFERLVGLAFGQLWPLLAIFETSAVGFAAGGAAPDQVVLVAVDFPALVALAAGIGFATFALFPSSADRRGPVALLRFGVSGLLCAPPLVVGAAVPVIASTIVGLGAAALVALVEAAALVGVAAQRLDGRMGRLPD